MLGGVLAAVAYTGYGVYIRRSRSQEARAMLLTIAKVFLFDLGHLTGLYRAASVFGLGVSLLLVSLLYQRFVFRRGRATPT